MREAIVDAFRLVCKCYEIINRSALHTYHSALVFTPTQQALYQRYCKEMTHKACWLRGGLAQWRPLVATVNHPGGGTSLDFTVRFSPDSSQLAPLTPKDIRFWDAISGTPISCSNLRGENITLADDFSVVAVPCNNTIKLNNAATDMPIATFTHSSEVTKLALSHDGSQLAAALSNNTINLWDVQEQKSIATLDGSSAEQLMFSPWHCVLASLLGGEIQLWNGTNGDFIACLDYGPEAHVEFLFSCDGSRLASLTQKGEVRSLALWNCENGNFIGAAKDVGDVKKLAISDDGSFIAAIEGLTNVKLWSAVGRNRLSLIDTIEIGKEISLEISRDLLAIASCYGGIVKLYDLRSRTFISTLQLPQPVSLAMSPDGTRFAAGNGYGAIHLWDVASIRAAEPASNKQSSNIIALAFSPDCSRLAAGFEDGTIELWNTDQAGQPIANRRLHSQSITGLDFSPDGEQLASGSWDKTVRVWDGKNGSTSGIIEHKFTDRISSVAFSSGHLVAATPEDVTIWDRKTLHLIDAINLNSLSLPFSQVFSVLLAFSQSGSLLAIACRNYSSMTSSVAVWNMEERTVIAPPLKVESSVRNLTLSPDGSQLFVEKYDGHFDFSTFPQGKPLNGQDTMIRVGSHTPMEPQSHGTVMVIILRGGSLKSIAVYLCSISLLKLVYRRLLLDRVCLLWDAGMAGLVRS